MRRGLHFLLFFLSIGIVYAQQPMSVKMKKPVICYASGINSHSYVPPPKEYLNRRAAQVQTATIEVTFSAGFPANAQTAFNRAVVIWEALIYSPVPIKIQANWSTLAEGVLGSAIYWSAYANFPGAQKLNVYYPVALAEKMAGEELNDPADFEIFANFNANINWYNGTGTPGVSQYDFETVVLHEIGHGLGFSSSFNVDGTQGEVGAFDTTIPIIYDAFIVNGSNVNLVQGFNSPSTSLKTQLTSNNLKINISKTPVATAQLYAPVTYDGGSSISHLNESTYLPGSNHALMTPAIGLREVNHDPGSLSLGILSDLGWETVRIEHDPLPNTENVTGPYTATVKLFNDGSGVQYDANNVILHYTADGTNFNDVPMAEIATDEFSASIPQPPSNPFVYGYYVSVGDNVGRTAIMPGKVVAISQQEVQNLITFEIGPDTKNPKIIHSQPPYLRNTETQLELTATISDNIGIGSATIEYTINGTNPQTLDLTLSQPEEDSVYTVLLTLGTLLDGDQIQYTITATDNSANPKTTTSPPYTVGVFGFSTAVDTYVNNFNTASSDFFGNGFSITTPSGFSNPAIHSTHPYVEGDAFPENELYLEYLLKVPIRVATENTWLRFDEVVLIEPGADGSVFGDADFFDYVVVEGSTNFGETWIPLANGYDSRDRIEWLNRYNSSFVGNNSSATGNSTFFRTRGINLNDSFNATDEVILRFKLYSDQLAAGWGWAIDNLYIQDAITGTEKELDVALTVYPNPTKGNIIVAASGLSSMYFNIQLMNMQGQKIYEANVESVNGKISHSILASAISTGLYFVKVSSNGKNVIRKVIKH